ncbi:hypothetical protein [Saccharothrix sp. Mg75]|uniref:hypothetical protein n=1 Tax=Saccharothrix sp. Mg75 TaxID=3445357 RepID=UPI003EEEEFB2
MPEPMLVSIAASLAARTASTLYDLVRTRFAGDPEAAGALVAADGQPEGSSQVAALGEALERTAAADPGFAEALGREYGSVTQTGRVVNHISGTVHGNVLQAGDIQGGVSFS